VLPIATSPQPVGATIGIKWLCGLAAVVMNSVEAVASIPNGDIVFGARGALCKSSLT
jgi:hypothetical protein